MASERLTPFMIYFCEVKDAVHAAHPTAAPHEISRIVYDQWTSLPAEKGRGYSILSATYAQSKKAPPMNRKKRERKDRDPKAPKSATSAYMFFSKHHRMLLKQENADLSFGDLGKTVGAMWKAATPEEKRPFEELAAEDRVRYLGELSQYKALQSSHKEDLRLAGESKGVEGPRDESVSSSSAASAASKMPRTSPLELSTNPPPPSQQPGVAAGTEAPPMPVAVVAAMSTVAAATAAVTTRRIEDPAPSSS
mmetsp:Transcript_25937/g.75594  ORF Transcript_25937/g.75594 Transcript_25937/m.75594 type:complete len:251 (-) Transcript_25937:36-788(-)